MNRFLSSTLLASVVFASAAFADDAKRPDNTGVNKTETPTADNSKNGKSDVKITAEIRRAIMKDDSLSTSAHNVKIIVQAGAVTLKGPVKSADEKTKVCAKANDVVGATNVTNQIEIAP
jgi:hyperosmotically inducible protein